jgi:DNA-binding IclR family transcriptional regulator
VTTDFQIGTRAGLHCTSIGKLLLAYQGAAAVEQVIRAVAPVV